MKTFFELREEAVVDEGKKGVVLGFKDQYKSRSGAESDGQLQMKKLGGSSLSVYKATNGLWAYKIFEGVEGLDEMFDKVHPTLKKELGSHAAHAVGMAGSDKGVAVSFDRPKDINALKKQMSQHGYKNVTPVGSHKNTYHFSEEVKPLDEAGPKIKPDFVKVQRAKDAAHNDAMGRTATGRKKPVRTMTSTQRSMASMNKEEVELDEGISNLSHSRLKYHATKGVSHGSYSTAEIKDEHKRRLRSEPDYVKAKASMNEAIAAKPDATEVIRKKKQMAAISTPDKDKLSKIAQMMARANEGLEQDGPRKPGGDGLSKNFGKQYGKKADAYLDKKAKERRDQAAKNDPGASKKNLGPAVIDTDKADKKAKAKGTSMAARFQNKMAAKK